MAGLFDKIREDVKKGIEEGIAAVIEGASVVSEKMGELTAEGKRQYKIFDLKSQIQNLMTELGGRAYDVLDSKKSPAADNRIKAVFVKIQKLEEQLDKLEKSKETKTAVSRRRAARAKTAPKKTATRSAKKMVPKTARKASIKKRHPSQ